jgi:acyl-CoA dehydrogenase
MLSPPKEEVRPAEGVAKAQLPDDATRWQTVIPVIEELKAKARKLGLWNLFLSKAHYPEHGVPLTNLEVYLSSISRLPCFFR